MTLFTDKAPWIMDRLMADFDVLEPVDAAAIVGNLGHETGGFKHMQELKPTVAGSRGGFGWAQWTGPRRKAFESWAAARKLELSSDEANYGFLAWELKTSELKAVPATVRAEGLAAKVEAFERAFERAGVKHYPSRIKWAEQAYAAWKMAEPAPKPVERPRPDFTDPPFAMPPDAPVVPPKDFAPEPAVITATNAEPVVAGFPWLLTGLLSVFVCAAVLAGAWRMGWL